MVHIFFFCPAPAPAARLFGSSSSTRPRQNLQNAVSRCASSLDNVDPEAGAVGGCDPHLMTVEESGEVLAHAPADSSNIHYRMDGRSDPPNRRWVTFTGDQVGAFPAANVQPSGVPFSNQVRMLRRKISTKLEILFLKGRFAKSKIGHVVDSLLLSPPSPRTQVTNNARTLTAVLRVKRIFGFQTTTRALDYICTTCGKAWILSTQKM